MLQQGDLLSSWLMQLHWLMGKQMDEIQNLNNKKIKLKNILFQLLRALS